MTVLSSPIRAFNRNGIEEFKRQIARFGEGYQGSITDELILSNEFSSVVPGNAVVEQQRFTLKLEAARYLAPKIRQLQYPNKYYAAPLWAWLSTFYFDSVCPPQPDGIRHPRSHVYYIPASSRERMHHRHLLALSLRIYEYHGELAKPMLLDKIDTVNYFINEVASRQDLTMNRGILEAVNMLYWDDRNNRPKQGAGSHELPGALRRFITVIGQLDLTYDLHALTGQQIVDMLPRPEFDRWRKG